MTHALLSASTAEVSQAHAEAATLVVVRMKSKPGHEAAVTGELSAALDRIRRGVPECTEIRGYVDPLEEDTFMLYEKWRSLAEFRTYLTRDDMRAYLSRLDQLLESREITVWHEFAGRDA